MCLVHKNNNGDNDNTTNGNDNDNVNSSSNSSRRGLRGAQTGAAAPLPSRATQRPGSVLREDCHTVLDYDMIYYTISIIIL